MAATPDEPEEAAADKPGKTRTWWHPLLANCLPWQLGSHYELHEEFPVGRKPLQIDILLLRKHDSDLPQRARQILAGLVEYLNDYTLVELKSPSDTLRAGDFQTFLAYALLYRAQNNSLLDPSRLSLILIAPRLTRPYDEELRLLGVTKVEERPGVWRLEGPTLGHRVWALETGVLAGINHPLLSMVSPQLRDHGLQTYGELSQAGYTELAVYVIQQMQQFHRLGKEFAMQHLGTEDELVKILQEFQADMPLEQRLAGLTPEQRLAGLSPEQCLAGLSPEVLEGLKKLLQQHPKTNGTSSPG